MHVGFFFGRHVVIENVRHLIHIDSSSRNIGGHQNRRPAAAKLLQRSLATILTLVRMNGCRRQASLRQLSHNPIRTMLRATENNRTLRHQAVQQLHQQCRLLLLRHNAHALFHQLRRLLLRLNRNVHRIPQNRRCQLPYLRPHRGRKQQRLTLLRNPLQYPPNRREKPHVQHPIRFVQHQHLQTVHAGTALLHQIQQSARSRHDDIRTVPQRSNLRLHPHTTINNRRTNSRKGTVAAKTFVNLQCQFASTGEHQHADRTHPRTLTAYPLRPATRLRSPLQLMQQRQCKRRRLAGARLSNPDNVPTLQNRRDGLLLNRCRNAVTGLGHSAHKGLTKPQLTELHIPSSWEKNETFPGPKAENRRAVCARLTSSGNQPFGCRATNRPLETPLENPVAALALFAAGAANVSITRGTGSRSPNTGTHRMLRGSGQLRRPPPQSGRRMSGNIPANR